MMRPDRSSVEPLPISSAKCSDGNSGVRFSNRMPRGPSGGPPLMLSTLTSEKYRSPSLGARILQTTLSPVRMPKRRTWLGDT